MYFKFIYLFIFSLIVIISIFNYQCYAQEQYQTKNGLLSITSGSNEELPTIHSNKLYVSLNLKTAEFDFVLPIQSLHSGVDSIDNRFYKEENNKIIVSGIMRMDGINTQPHAPIHFTFVARLNNNELLQDLKGEGHLEHIPGKDQPACRLRLNFKIDDFELLDGFREDFNFQIIQSILYQPNMN